jgi:hypothetical protein
VVHEKFCCNYEKLGMGVEFLREKIPKFSDVKLKEDFF